MNTNEVALKQCCANYEDAIKLSQAECAKLEKERNEAVRKLNKLTTIVRHNVKNPDVIFKQLNNGK